MANAYKLLAQVIPGTSAAQIYAAATSPSSTQAIIRHINYINVVGSHVTVDLWQNGSSTINKIAGGTRRVLANDGGADGSIEIDTYITMQPANTLWAKAGASNAIVINIWGVEIT